MTTPGRALITLCNLNYSVGALYYELSDTHILNPRWPPHAKFHNGQALSLSLLLACTSIYFANRNPVGTKAASVGNAKREILTAAVIGSFYCMAGLSAILYPGTEWMDPGSPDGGGQKYVFVLNTAVMWVGCAVELRSLGRVAVG